MDFGLHLSSREGSNFHIWRSLSLGWHKVNMNGEIRAIDNRVACVGNICNHKGDFVVEFTVGIDKVSIIHYEVDDIIVGLKLTLGKGLTHILVDTNSI